MRRVDRAIFAIFLLAVVADVARAYALTPVSSEISGSLILHAASQLQGSPQAEDIPANRGLGYSARRMNRTAVLAAWSKSFRSSAAESFRSPVLGWGQVALLHPDAVLIPQVYGYYSDSPHYPPAASLERIERAGNPAP